jgi:hypothetical protein
MPARLENTLNTTKENTVVRLGSHSVSRTGKTTPDNLELCLICVGFEECKKAASSILKH